ncbi:uncharacterized protein HaLaN_29479 [Haematococcus lacustris]|uniref:Uncharacterized protein n=1 Tax=Haematococcus lacustris TaxID=44745 RepID=A0A6A0ACW4_HAELA|nr:uncharacterized protein HaLaN_29479 [Haematococcus lacustris]
MGVEPSTVATSPDPDFVGATPQAEHSHERIASELDLERFSTLPIEQRQLTEPLRGVLAETALSGVIRYNWTLLRPLVEFGLSQQPWPVTQPELQPLASYACNHAGTTGPPVTTCRPSSSTQPSPPHSLTLDSCYPDSIALGSVQHR